MRGDLFVHLPMSAERRSPQYPCISLSHSWAPSLWTRPYRRRLVDSKLVDTELVDAEFVDAVLGRRTWTPYLDAVLGDAALGHAELVARFIRALGAKARARRFVLACLTILNYRLASGA